MTPPVVELWGFGGLVKVNTQTKQPLLPISPQRADAIPHWISGYLHVLACDGKADHYAANVPAVWFDITALDIEGEPALKGMARVYLIYGPEKDSTQP